VISDTLATALKLQETGDLARAEQLYRQVLEIEPAQGQALRALGGIAYRQGRHGEAVAWLRQAVTEQSDPVLQNNLGAACRAAGRIPEAETCYRQALRLKPDFAEAYNNLANVMTAQGRRQEALACYRLAVLTQPNYADAHNNLGLALLERGELDEAAAHFGEAVRLKPALAEAHQGLGLVLIKQNRLDEAAHQLEEALRLQPLLELAHFHLGQILRSQARPAEALPHLFEALRLKTTREKAAALLPPVVQSARVERVGSSEPKDTPLAGPAEAIVQQGLSLKNQGKLDEAAACFREAVQIDPDAAQAYFALGRVLEERGRLEEAASAFHHVLRLQPERAEAYLALGATLREQVQLERAVTFLREAIRLRPDLAEAYHQLGLALTDQGLEDEAEAVFRDALRLRPDNVPTLSHLGILLEESGSLEEGRVLLEKALALNPRDVQVHVHYGTSLVNQGRFEEARAQYLQAVALQPSCGAAYFFLARDVKHTFAEEEVRRMAELLERDELSLRDRLNLHFALARVYDRSGDNDQAFHHCELGNTHKQELLRLQGNAFDSAGHTRMVDRLLAVFTPDYFDRVRSFGTNTEVPVFIVGMPRSGTTLVEQILASHPEVHGAGETRHIKRLVAELPLALSSRAEYPEGLDRLDRPTSVRLAEGYLQGLQRLGGNKLRVTDKQPMNFHHLGLIATLFPRARIIHCRRDPRDVGWSCYFQNFREIYFASDLRVLGTYQRQYERIMAHWRSVLPVPIFEVCYEELVKDLERVSREMISFCSLSWDARCLSFHETKRVVRTSSNFQVREPVYRGSVGNWKHYERYLGPLLEALHAR
jgi:tetratricopeptide (TPR) repeat protein